MKFCSECGGRVAPQGNAHLQRHYVCIACGAAHYENPRVIVSCIVCWNGKVLTCRRSQEPARGEWTVPSGFLECGETLEECAVRETLEETGVMVEAGRLELYSVMNMTAIEQVGIAFRTTVDADPHPRPGPECMEVAFMAEAELVSTGFAWRQSMGDSLERLFREMRSGNFSIRLATIGSDQGVGFKFREYEVRAAAGSEATTP